MSKTHYKVFLFWICTLQAGSCKGICPSSLSNECQCAFNQSTSLPTVSCNFSSQSKPQSLWRQGISGYGISLNNLRISLSFEKKLPDNFFFNITTVNYLNLSCNSMTMFPDAILRMVKIKYLDLSHNAYSNMDAKPDAQLVVQSLNLSSNDITFVPRLFFKMFKNLQRLDLSKNSLKILPEKIFVYLIWIRYLDLSHNSLQHISQEHFGKAGRNLQVINLRGNQLKQIEPKLFRNFASLKSIDLAFNGQMSNMATIAFPPHLSHLDLSMCMQKSLNFCELLQIPDLLVIKTDGNSIPCGCEIGLVSESLVTNREVLMHPDLGYSSMKCRNKLGQEVEITEYTSTCNEKQKSDFVSQCMLDEMKWKKEFRMDTKKCRSEISLQTQISDDSVMAEWKVGRSCTQVYGYYLHIHDEEEQVVKDTVILHPTTTSYTFTDPKLCCGQLHVCLKVMLNSTYVFYEECQFVFTVHGHMVAGILAGAVFLIPCTFVLIYVMYNDRKQKKKQNCEGTENWQNVKFSNCQGN